MADHGVSNERRKELEQMDAFQKNLVKGLAFASAHTKQLIMILGAVVVVLALLATTIYSFKRAETTAARLTAQAGGEYNKTISETQDPKAGYDAVKADYEKIFEEYANTSAGEMALVTYARICSDAGEYDKAYTYYLKALENLDNQAGMENMLLTALGNMAMMKDDPAKAKAFYLRIEKGSSDLMKDEARFALAQIYAAENDMEASLKMYEKILQDKKNSMYKAIAQAKAGGE
jgi:tetratricopeptide (TPR) repeat protein